MSSISVRSARRPPTRSTESPGNSVNFGEREPVNRDTPPNKRHDSANGVQSTFEIGERARQANLTGGRRDGESITHRIDGHALHAYECDGRPVPAPADLVCRQTECEHVRDRVDGIHVVW